MGIFGGGGRNRPPEYGPESGSNNDVLWEWVHSLGYAYGAVAGRPIDELSSKVLGALAPSRFGPMLHVDGSRIVFTELPAFQATSDGYVDGQSGWQVNVVGLQSPDGDASALLWWIHGGGDEMQRCHGQMLRGDVAGVVRKMGGNPCTVMKGGVADDTYHLDNVLARQGKWPAIKNHELGRRMATWQISTLSR